MDALQAYTPGSDFDFGAFLRDDTLDMDVVLPDRSTGTEEGASTSPTDSSSQPGGGGEMVRVASGKRHERRGHTKSRRGCFNCKRRRIKVGHYSLYWVLVERARGRVEEGTPQIKDDGQANTARSARRPSPRAATASRRASSASTLPSRRSPTSRTTRSRSSACRTCASSSTSC